MRILISGLVVFVIWSLFSVWLYTKKIRPALSDPASVQQVQDPATESARKADSITNADSVLQQKVVMPNDLITYFDFDDASFINDSKIDKHAEDFQSWLNENPETKLLITGHTDSKGSSDYNQKLGLKRAKSMQKYFIEFGINADKIETISKGEKEPVAEQTTETGRAKNRRAVITLKN